MKRYDRQIILSELGIEGQEKLKLAKVLVIGAGGLGCPVLLYLTGAGVGNIGIVDDDLVEESNLHRQVLFNMQDLGNSKAETAVNKLRVLNPYVSFTAYNYRLKVENAAELFSGYDLIIDGSDNFPTRYLANDTCVQLDKPLVFGSIFQFEGQVSVFNYEHGPDYRTLYPEAPSAEDVPNCGESGVIGTLPGVIGSVMANEAIKVICQFGEVLSGKLLTFNALDNEVIMFNFGNHELKETEYQKSGHQHVPRKDVREVDVRQLEKWDEDDVPYQLVDVREEYEFEEFNLGGINIPLHEISTRSLELRKLPTLVLYCSSGQRSKIAFNLLKGEFKGEIYLLQRQPVI